MPRRSLRACLGILITTAVLPATASAQAPPYLTQWGTQGSGNGQFNFPYGVAVDGSGDVYVTDYLNNRVQKFSSDGVFLLKWGGFDTVPNHLNLAVDATGRVYVADRNYDRIRVFSSTGTFLTEWTSPFDNFWNPQSVAVATNGVVYVPIYGDRVQAHTNTGGYLMQWGTLGSGSGQFNNPWGVATDAMGNIYVVDTDNHRIQKFVSAPTPVQKVTWGSVKARYRAERGAVQSTAQDK